MSVLDVTTPAPVLTPASTLSTRGRLGFAAFMAGAGITHFVAPGFYAQVVPKWIGHEKQVVAWSGVAEILCGTLVAIPRTRRLGAWLSLVLLIVVYPANIDMAVQAGPPRDAESWAAWIRLPFQFPMFWWAVRTARR